MQNIKYELAEIIQRKLIALPDPSLVFTDDISSVAAKGGIYIFYTKYGEALYTGISNNLKRRLKQHLTNRGNKDLHKYLSEHDGVYIEFFYEESAAYQELYESLIIIQLMPRYNVSKTNRKR